MTLKLGTGYLVGFNRVFTMTRHKSFSEYSSEHKFVSCTRMLEWVSFESRNITRTGAAHKSITHVLFHHMGASGSYM